MSSLNNLSVATGVIQIVSFAGNVFQAGKAVYELFDKARSASRSITLLLLELRALLSVVAYVHVAIAEHAASPFCLEDGHTLPNIHTVLMLINQNFLHLKGLVSDVAGLRNRGWLSVLHSNIRWALKDNEILAAKKRLFRYTQNLSAALSVSGRRNDIVLRTKIQSIEEKLRDMVRANCTPISNLVTSMQSHTSQKSFHASRRHIKATIPQKQHRTNPVSVQRQICSNVDIVHVELDTPVRNYPRFNLFEQNNCMLILDTGNYTLEEITRPLVMLQNSLLAPSSEKYDTRIINLNINHLEIIRTIFDFVTISAMNASTTAISKKYSLAAANKICLTDLSYTINRQLRFSRRYFITRQEISLERQAMQIKTEFGPANLEVLFARSLRRSEMLYFEIKYHGNRDIHLTPFRLAFTSNVLSYCPRPQRAISAPRHVDEYESCLQPVEEDYDVSKIKVTSGNV